MTDSSASSPAARGGLVAGPLLLVIGIAAAWMASGFDAESRAFPFALGTLLGLAGGGILLQALLASRRAMRFDGQAQVAAAVLFLALWALAFNAGLGFVVPTFLLQAGLLWIGGIRRPPRLLALAVSITLVAWGLFVGLLDIPLPPSLLPDALQRF